MSIGIGVMQPTSGRCQLTEARWHTQTSEVNRQWADAGLQKPDVTGSRAMSIDAGAM